MAIDGKTLCSIAVARALSQLDQVEEGKRNDVVFESTCTAAKLVGGKTLLLGGETIQQQATIFLHIRVTAPLAKVSLNRLAAHDRFCGTNPIPLGK